MEQYYTLDTVLIGSHLFITGPQAAAEKLGIPFIRVFPSIAYVTGLPLLEILCEFLAEDINRFRAAVDLPSVTDWHAWLRCPDRNIGAWPDWFAAPEPSWPSGLDLAMVGFLTFDEAETGESPEELGEFLNDGDPPILITGGTSMYLKSDFYAVCVEACRLLNRRGVLVTRHQQLVPKDLPDQVKWFGFLPFADVMPRMAAVVHHGGMGTQVRALKAGTPQLSLAASADRPDTAMRFQRLGVAEYLPPSQWKPELIAEALQRLSSSDVGKCCQEMALRVRSDNPATAVCDIIEELVPQRTPEEAGSEEQLH